MASSPCAEGLMASLASTGGEGADGCAEDCTYEASSRQRRFILSCLGGEESQRLSRKTDPRQNNTARIPGIKRSRLQLDNFLKGYRARFQCTRRPYIHRLTPMAGC